MRAGPSVCLKVFGAAPILVAGLVLALVAGFDARAWAAEDAIEAQSDIELPAEVAPGDAEAPADDDVVEPDGNPIQPKLLDRSFMRPDLKQGGEGVPAPQSVEERKQDKLDPAAEAELPLPTPVERPKMLGELYEQLGKVHDAKEAAPIAQAIENLWLTTGSATVDLLMSRAVRFTKDSDLDLALQILDATADLAPEEAEVWYLRAKVHYRQQHYALALTDLKRAIARDPKHYRALEDLGLVFEALGTKKEALEAYRKALAINPFLPEADQAVQFLSREVGGRDI
jgi:tetratricopeptide (TPR) repeat protein